MKMPSPLSVLDRILPDLQLRGGFNPPGTAQGFSFTERPHSCRQLGGCMPDDDAEGNHCLYCGGEIE